VGKRRLCYCHDAGNCKITLSVKPGQSNYAGVAGDWEKTTDTFCNKPVYKGKTNALFAFYYNGDWTISHTAWYGGIVDGPCKYHGGYAWARGSTFLTANWNRWSSKKVCGEAATQSSVAMTEAAEFGTEDVFVYGFALIGLSAMLIGASRRFCKEETYPPLAPV